MSLRTLLIVLAVVVLFAAWLLGAIGRHLEEHRHCSTYAMSSVERAQHAERNARGEVDRCHDRSVEAGSAGDHVREARP